jgi:hypothetical protein
MADNYRVVAENGDEIDDQPEVTTATGVGAIAHDLIRWLRERN